MEKIHKKIFVGLVAGLLMTVFNIVFCVVVIGLVVGVVGGIAFALTTTGWDVLGAIFIASYSYHKLKDMSKSEWPNFAKKYADHISGLFYIIMSSSGVFSKRVVSVGVLSISIALTVVIASGFGYWVITVFESFKEDMKGVFFGGIMVFIATLAFIVAISALAVWVLMSFWYTGYLYRIVRGRMPEISDDKMISKR